MSKLVSILNITGGLLCIFSALFIEPIIIRVVITFVGVILGTLRFNYR